MERVHNSSFRPWIGEKINVKSFRDEWAIALGTVMNFESSDVSPKLTLMETLEQPQSVIDKLAEECNEGVLACPGDDDIETHRIITMPEDVELQTLKSQKEDTDKRYTDLRYKNFVYNNSKCTNYPPSEPLGNKALAVEARLLGAEEKQPPAAVEKPFVRVQDPEVILTVQVYRPEKAHYRYQKHAPPRIPVFLIDQELNVVGDQCLNELRDCINCVSDMAVPGEFSDEPFLDVEVTFKDIYKSGFFYINGVLYSDMREPTAKDYTQVIRDWFADKPDCGIGPFTYTTMESAKFIDLEIQLGYPYVYIHQGDCEHLFVFSDLRMLHDGDSLNQNDYPMCLTLLPKKRTFCMVCHTLTAKWVVNKNDRLPEDPYFFCEECFLAFNYDESGAKIGNFEARKYIDRTLLL